MTTARPNDGQHDRPPVAPRQPADGPLDFERAVEQVEAIIDRIESGEVGLEQSITEYERGVALIRRCRQILDRAEQRVEELTAQMQADTVPSTSPPQARQSTPTPAATSMPTVRPAPAPPTSPDDDPESPF